jgi:hypothetical protein
MKTVKITTVTNPHIEAWFNVYKSYPGYKTSQYDDYTTSVGTRRRMHRIREIVINDIKRL